MAISRSTGSPSLNLPRDTNFNRTVLLLHGDGTTGANNTMFVDNSKLETYIPFKGTYSIYLPTTSDKISTASSYTFAGVFTLEFFMYIPATLGGAGSTVCGVFTAGGFNIWYDGTRVSPNVYGTGNIFNSTFNPSLNTWYYVVVTRNASNLMTMYVNGVSVGSTTTSASYTSGQFSLQYSGGYGYISNVRLTNTDVYGGSVTIPTTPLTSIDGTQFILAQSNRIIDSSTINQTITTSAGTPVISSGGPAVVPAGKPGQGTFTPFNLPSGYWSSYISSSNYITTTGKNYGTSTDFTFECWVNLSSATQSGQYGTIMNGGTGNLDVELYYINGTTVSGFTLNNFGSGAFSSTSGSVFNTGQWHHFVLTRVGSTWRAFVDGVLVIYVASASSTANFATLGGGSAATSMVGFLSNVRLVDGTVAAYTTTSTTVGAVIFTPPTSPLTVISNTIMLNCQSINLIDANTSQTITTTSAISTRPFSPFIPTKAYSKDIVSGSVYFNGTTDYLTVPSNTGFAFGTGDYTVECWIYPLDTTSGRRIVEFSDNNDNLDLNVAGAGYISYYNGSTSTSSSSAVVKLNAWNHIASVRSSGTVKVYVNGSVAVTQSTTPNTASARALNIAGVTNVWFNGYISNFRVLKGTALYTSNFTPPATPLTSVANTTLLVNSTNAGIIDQTGKNNLASYGSVAISSAQSKFGGSSILFNNSLSSCFVLPSSPNITIPASSNFTLECWLNTPATGFAPAVWQNAGNSRIIAFFLTDAAVSGLYSIMGEANYPPASNAVVVRATSDIVANTWTHVAFVRTGGSTVTIYINGIASGTASNSFATNALQIIGAIAQGGAPNFYFFNGYIDELRLTQGVARYTANFTPPARKFEDR